MMDTTAIAATIAETIVSIEVPGQSTTAIMTEGGIVAGNIAGTA